MMEGDQEARNSTGGSMANKDKGTKGGKKEAKKNLKEKRASKKAKKSGGGNTMRPA